MEGNPQRYLILINPTSGQKLAEKYYQKYLLKIIQEHAHEIEFQVRRTEFAGHAFDMAKHGDLTDFDGIITVSGDGLIFEVVNGLYQRCDWDRSMSKLKFGILAGGTGNSLTCSLSLLLNQSLDDLGVTSSVENIKSGLKTGRTENLDFIEIEQHCQRDKVVSFIGVAIGLIADVDIGTECLRCIGYLRAYLMVIWRIIQPKTYRVKVSYLPYKSSHHESPPQRVPMPDITRKQTENLPPGWISETNSYYLIYAENVPLLDSLTLMAPQSEIGDSIIWLVLVREGMSRLQMIHWLINAHKGAHIGKPGVEIIPVKAFRLEPIYPEGYLTIDGESYPFGTIQGQMLPNKAKLLAAEFQ